MGLYLQIAVVGLLRASELGSFQSKLMDEESSEVVHKAENK